jgi:hypothetical protein
VATFLVLPPRELLEHAVTEFANRILPGLPKPLGLSDVLLAQVIAGLPRNEQAFVVYREELPEGENTAMVLQEAFGAEPGDRIVEIGAPRNLTPSSLKESFVPGQVSTVPSVR